MNINRLFIKGESEIISSRFVRQRPETYRYIPFFKPAGHFLYYHIKGERRLEKDGVTYKLNEGDVVLFLSGYAYITPVPETEYEAINILFTPSPLDKVLPEGIPFENTYTDIHIPFITNVKEDVEIKLMFEEIARLSVAFHPLRKLKSQYLLKQLLINLATRYEFSQDKLLRPAELIIELIRSNPEKNFKIDDLAKRLNLGRSSITKSFRRVTGKSIKSYELEIKINTALNMIQSNPNIKFKELSETLGFNDEYHFSNTFKKIIGKSPLTFRKMLNY